MTLGPIDDRPIDDYLSQLEQALRDRGLDDARLLAEARDHVDDAVADAVRRGLSEDEAARDALERFGAPDIVAAQMAQAEHNMQNRFVGVLETVWRRKWWILAPTLATTIVTSVLSSFFLPTRYRSATTIIIVDQRVPKEYVAPTITSARSKLEAVTRMITSRTRLERIIQDFDLYQAERKELATEELIARMRGDIGVELVGDESIGSFDVSFVSSDPRTAMRVTERLATLFIEESLREREVLAASTTQLIDAQIEGTRRRIIEYEEKLDALRAQRGPRAISQADLLPYEVLKERYKALLATSEDARLRENLERRQIGEQYKLLDPARVPERPVGPGRLAVNTAGALAGLVIGLTFVAARKATPRVTQHDR